MKYFIHRTMYKNYIYRIKGNRVERRDIGSSGWFKSGLSGVYVHCYLKQVSEDDVMLELI